MPDSPGRTREASPRRSPIYVEIGIETDLERLWNASQDPAAHRTWDLRFTEIEYLPRASPEVPQEFLYATRVGFGLRIEGTGRSTGAVEKDGARTSALTFESSDRLSLIREGSGYWKYLPGANGSVTFLTWYDYRTRFGRFGGWIDRLAVRPLLGWATAWSFDRLRLWLERGLRPSESLRFALIHAVSRSAIGLVWIYMGLVPKWLVARSGELDLVRAAGLFAGHEQVFVHALGAAEIAFGLALLVLGGRKRIWIASGAAVLALTIAALVSRPSLVGLAFNPVVLAIALLALHAVLWTTFDRVPSARRTKRAPSLR